MTFLTFALFLLPFIALGADVSKVPPDSDVGLDMVAIVQERGYTIETHYVTTKDGYILTMFRIPHSKTSTDIGFPVLLQHGLLDSSYTWVSNYEDESLAYILSDNGFDVWFGNNRGNRYGRNHTSLDPDDGTNAFWAFTWDEMGAIDMPAMVNYVLNVSSYSSLNYVGHSEGTIQMFAGATSLSSQDADLVKAVQSINLFVALAPVAYVSNMASKILVALANSDLPQNLFNRGLYEFLPYGPIDQVAPEICQMFNKGCDVFLMAICGPTRHINDTRIQVYVSNTPAGTSTQNMLHWMQGVLTPTFQKYDFGSEEENMDHYGTPSPPMYDLSQLAVNTALFSGKHDYLADPLDVQRIADEIPADKLVYWDIQEDYAHLDYVWAYDAKDLIYPKVVELLTQYAA